MFEKDILEGRDIDNGYYQLISLTENEWEKTFDHQTYLNLIDTLIKEYEKEEKYEKCKILLELKEDVRK